VGKKRVRKLRRRVNITDPNALPPIRLVVIDFVKANHVDSTACTHMKALVQEIRKYGGNTVNVRFACMSRYVRQRFERAGWKLVDGDEPLAEGEDEDDVVRVYSTVAAAVMAPRCMQSLRGSEDDEGEKAGGIEKVSTAGGTVTTTMHQETAWRG